VKQSKLLDFLKETYGHLASMRALKRAIDKGGCLVNGRIEKFSTRRLTAQDKVTFDPSFIVKRQEPLFLEILYEDEELLIVAKPAGCVCEDSVINTLLPSYQGSLKLIHRLDKDTTGVLLIAKTLKMKEGMVDLFRKRAVKKKYLAVVLGNVKKAEGEIEGFMVRKSPQFWSTAPQGLPAHTLWKRLYASLEFSFLECQPITGRTHQLRVHLSSIGHPILGDAMYGGRHPKRMQLHASCLAFEHPIKHVQVEVKAALPKDMQWIRSLL